jgi:glutamate dehydrogenase
LEYANISGYISSPFPAKATQQAQVAQILTETGFMPAELVSGEVDWFYNSLGIDNAYFSSETPQQISDSVLALFSAKLLAFTKHDPSALKIELEKVTTEEECKEGAKEGAVFIHSSAAGISAKDGPGATVEKRIDDMFIDKSTPQKAYRLESYRSAGSISASVSQQLRCYFVSACEFPAGGATQTASGTTDIKSVSDKTFLEKATPTTIDLYQGIMDEVSRRSGPVIESFQIEDTREYRIIIGYKAGGTRRYFSALSDLYHFYGLYSTRKFVEQFANGTTIISLYLGPIPNSKAPPIEHSIQQVVREASLLWCLPDNPFFSVAEGESPHAVQEATYAYVGWIFAQHFCNRLGPAYAALKDVLDDNNPDHADVLAKIKTRFREETFTRELIRDVLQTHPELVRLLYINFAMVHYPAADEASQLTPTLSFQRIKTVQPLSDQDLYAKIKREATNSRAAQVLEALLIFNKHVTKTNFYQPTKVALSFRLDPSFLPDIEYPKLPYAIMFVVGAEMRGFHVRFRDVARGGIRIVRSRNKENWAANVRTLFDENYNLAYTQTLKNKDIPEGGSKGTILPSLGANYEVCFEKYIDAVIDLLIPGQSPGIKGPIVDTTGRKSPEVLFLGPDEGTAEMMDWAAFHAKARGAPWWKSFTTGKSKRIGGEFKLVFPTLTPRYPPRRLRHDLALGPPVRPRRAQDLLRERQAGHQAPVWWPRRRPRLERDPPLQREGGDRRHHRRLGCHLRPQGSRPRRARAPRPCPQDDRQL